MYYAQHGMKTYHTSIRCRATERDGWNTLQHFRIRPYPSRIHLQALAATRHATDSAFDRRFVTKTQGCLIRFTRGTWAAQRPACHWIRLLPFRHDIHKNCEAHRAWYSICSLILLSSRCLDLRTNCKKESFLNNQYMYHRPTIHLDLPGLPDCRS